MAAAPGLLLFLKLSMALTFSGWVCVWVLKPTPVWKKAWHVAEDRAGSMFLGESALSFLVLCYPVLCLALLVYVYLHLASEEKRKRRQREAPSSIRCLSKPLITSSPVGVISNGEILSAVLFTALLVWTYYSNISSDLKKLTPPKSVNLKRWQLKTMRAGVRFGSLSEICLAVLFLPVLRSMSLFKILGIQFEASVRYHIWMGNVMMLFSAMHGMIIMFIWTLENSFWSKITRWQRTGRVNLAGAITLVTGLAIWITSLPQMRRRNFQLFYSAHHLYIIFIIFFLFHGGDRHFFLVLGGVLLLALDKILRTLQSRTTSSLISARLLPCRAVELTFCKHQSLKYTPTSIVFLKIPSISKFQWHPFTITSSSSIDTDRISVIIKCHGWWTNTLYSRIELMQASKNSSNTSLPIAVEGPYGPSANIFQRYDSLILIAGGSGITPFLSILEESIAGRVDTVRPPVKIQLIYVVKKTEDLSMLISISSLLQSKPVVPRQLRIRTFVTQERRPPTTFGDVMQEMAQAEINFSDSRCPIQSAPMPDSLPWKAAVTGVLSIIFLISLVCLSHATSPSKEKLAGDKNPSWTNNLIVVSSFIIATSCSTLITVISKWWRPKKEIHEPVHEQAKDAEMGPVEVMPALECHEVSFGKRPNLTDLLIELSSQTGKSNVGVFVCGPDSMQGSVATFCRRFSQTRSVDRKPEKNSFTFHSINFSL